MTLRPCLRSRTPTRHAAYGRPRRVVKDDFATRLVAKLEEVEAATRGINHLLLEASLVGLTRRARPPKLTAREQAVLGMLADGLTNREVGERLGLSHHTVKDHASSLYKRLGATNRANAVARARAAG